MPVKQNVPYQRVALVTAPAAGAEFALTAPGNGLWRVLSIAFRLVASAAVANRTVTLVADDGSSVWFRSAPTIQQTAAQTVDYGAYAGGAPGGVSGVAGSMPLVQDGLWLQPGWRLRSITSGIDALDQYSAIVALVEEFPSGPETEWAPTSDRAQYDRS